MADNINNETIGELGENETVSKYEKLKQQLSEIYNGLKELLKGKTGTPAVRHQMEMTEKLLSKIKAPVPETSSIFEEETEKAEIVNFTADDMPDNIIEFSSEVGPEESIIKKARIFYTGTHKGRVYTKEDMKRIVDNFDPAEGIPLQLDHSKSAKDTIGYPRTMELSSDGKEIYSNIEILGKDNVEKVRLGLWKKLSAGLSLKLPEMKADHVAVTPFPALSSATLFSKYGENAEKTQQALQNMINQSINTSEKLRQEFGISNDKEGGNNKMGDTNNQDQMQQVNMVEFTALKEEFARLEKEKGELEERIQFKEDAEYIETFTVGNEVKTTPAMREIELKLYHSLNPEQRALFADLKKMQPSFVDVAVYSTQKANKPGEKSKEEINKEADQILNYTR